MKKKGLMIGMVLSLAVCLCLALFCACGKTTDTGDTSQREIYNAYVAYATAAGDDVLSYEEWLDSIRGKDGKDGLNGKDGKDGSDGKDGKDGSDGKSAYDIWLENGHSGTESDFLNWLKGEKGDTGAQGLQGQKGEDGTDGKDGADGKDGQDGQDGKSAYDIWKENGHSGTEAEFLEWLKGEKGETGAQGQQGEKGQDGKDGKDGLSAYELFSQRCPSYEGSESQWLADLVNGNLTVYTVTFQSEVADDIVYLVCAGKDLTVIPEVPEKEGQASAKWDREDFTNITSDIEVHAVYTMKQFTVTFHNEFTEEEDETRTVEYGQAIEDVPTVTPKADQLAYWDVTDYNHITEDMTVNAVYETIGLAYTKIAYQEKYSVSAGSMNSRSAELFIPATHAGLPVTEIAARGFDIPSLYDTVYYIFKTVYLPESLEKIGSSAFYGCSSLKNINIPSKVTEIGRFTFWGCAQLTSINLQNVKTIKEGAFGCSGLSQAEMPNVETIESGNPNESGYSLDHGTKRYEYYSTGAFVECDDLVEVNLPKLKELGDYTFDMEFSRKSYNSETKLISVKLPKIVSIGKYAFRSCMVLQTIEMQNVSTIGEGAFEFCDALDTIKIPNAVSVGTAAFRNISCDYIEMPNVTEIVAGTFEKTIVEKLVISNKLTKIYDLACSGNDCSITSIYFEGKQQEYAAIEGVANLLGDVYFYEAVMPDANGESYWHWYYDESGRTPAKWE